MNNCINKKINTKYLVIIIFLIISTALSAQKIKKIKILNADKFTYSKELEIDARRLIGDVAFQHEDTYLYCDSAYLYIKTNNIDAFGNIHIKASDSLDIYGDTLNYDGNTKIAKLKNNVRLIDNQINLSTDNMIYDLNNNIGSYFSGGKIIDENNILTSKIGHYYSDNKEFFFKDSVVLINPEYIMNSDTLKYNTITEISYFYGPSTITSDDNFIYCENGWYNTISDISQYNKNAYLRNDEQTLSGDSLYYDRNLGFGKAFFNVVMIDTVQNIILKGQFAEYMEETGNSLITDSSVAIIVDEKDSLFLHADTLKMLFDSAKAGKTLFAYYKVKFFKQNLQGMCDSLVYDFKDSLIKLIEKPLIWSDKNQLSAEYIELRLSDNKIKTMLLQKSAFLVEQDDSTQFNQIKGKEMTGYFNDNKLKKVLVQGNSESVYFVRDENKFLIGVNKSVSSNLTIYLKNNEIHSILYLTEPIATLTPLKELSKNELILKGFFWEIEKRPKNKFDIFRW